MELFDYPTIGKHVGIAGVIFTCFLKETKSAGKNIPIVFTYGEDLLALGLIESYGSSGNNATGVLSNMAEVVPKQLEFLKRINPNAKRLGLFSDGFMYPGGPGELVVAKFRTHASKFDITLIEYTTKAPPGPQLEKAYDEIAATIKQGDLDAVYHVPGHFLHDQQNREIALGKRIKVVTIMPAVEELEESGGTFSYAFDLIVAGRQIAVMADKIFKGTKPSEIPIEWPRKDILGINIKTAREIGVTIPESMLLIANRVLEE